MSTTPVANTSSSAASSAARSNASRKSDSAGNPFQQMLSDEIAGKAPNTNKTEERVADASASGKQASAASGNKATKSDAGTADKMSDKAGEAVSKEENKEANAVGLPPELAAIVASLLQQQQQSAAAGEVSADTGQAEEADPLAALGKGQSRLGGDAQGKQDPLADLADSELTDASGHASQSSAKTAAQAASELELQAAVTGKQFSADTAGGEGESTEFSNVLQQLSQTAQASQARNGQPAAPSHLSPKVGTSAWDQALGQRVVWMASGAEQSASLTLNPPELGPLQVVLNVTNNQANATFVAPQAEVRQALEAAMPRLREMLGEAGIQLDQASVNQGTPQQQGEFGRSDSRGGSRGQGQGAEHGGIETAAEATASRRVTAAGNGLVDTFA